MIKLESNFKTGRNSEFYFRSKKECDAFLWVFDDHWCNVPWKKPVEIPDNTPLNEYWKEHINDDPKKLAVEKLNWGFSNCKYNNIGRTASQQSFLDDMVGKFS